MQRFKKLQFSEKLNALPVRENRRKILQSKFFEVGLGSCVLLGDEKDIHLIFLTSTKNSSQLKIGDH